MVSRSSCQTEAEATEREEEEPEGVDLDWKVEVGMEQTTAEGDPGERDQVPAAGDAVAHPPAEEGVEQHEKDGAKTDPAKSDAEL